MKRIKPDLGKALFFPELAVFPRTFNHGKADNVWFDYVFCELSSSSV